MASLTRTTAGLLARESFTDLSGWDAGAGWSSVPDPGYVAHPAPRVLLEPGTPGVDPDGGGVREPHLVAASDAQWHLFADAGDGSEPAGPGGPWQVKRYSSPDRGLTWVRHGGVELDRAGSAYAGHVSFCLSGWVNKVGDTYYMQVLSTPNLLGGRVPWPPYVNSVYAADSLDGPWSWVHDSPALGAPGSFDGQTAVVGHAYHDGAGWVGHYSAYDGSGHWGVGRCTAPALDRPWVKAGALPPPPPAPGSQVIPAEVWKPTTAFENPKVWHSAALSTWFMLGNQNASDMEQVFSAPTDDFSAAGVRRQGLMFADSPMFTANTLSVIAPFADDAGGVVQDAEGRVPVVWAGDHQGGPPTNFEWHRLRVGHLEPSSHVASFSGGAGVYLTRAMPAQDGVFDFQAEARASGAGNNLTFVYRLSGGASDAGSSGYALDVDVNTSAWRLYRLDAGAFTQLGSGFTQPYPLHGDARNAHATRVQVVLDGPSHGVYVDGRPVIDVTDAAHAGPLYGFRGVGGPVGVRGLTARTSRTVTVNGVPAGVAVTARGPGGYPIATAASDGSPVLLDVPYGGAATLEVGGEDFTPAGGVWGGDVYDYSAGG